MIEFTMEEVATVRFSTHQTELKNMRGIRLNRPKSLINTEYLLRCPPIESVGRFTRLTVEQTGLRLGFGFGTELKRNLYVCSCAPKRDPFETSSPIPT